MLTAPVAVGKAKIARFPTATIRKKQTNQDVTADRKPKGNLQIALESAINPRSTFLQVFAETFLKRENARRSRRGSLSP
jgi:hypothetical protein